MRILKEAFAGIAAALTTSLLVMGAIVLAITEGMVLPSTEPVEVTTTIDPMETILFSFTTPTPRPKPPLVVAPTQPASTPCPMPSGWEVYTVLKGENLRTLAQARQTTMELLVEKNCLSGTSLVSGVLLFLPPAPTPTSTPLSPTATFTPYPTSTGCATPPGWVRYLVRPGDNLFRIGLAYGVSSTALQKANCMGSSILIYPGQSIYVPNVTPRYTATSAPFHPSATAVRPSPTRTFTLRPASTFTPTSTAVPPTHTFTPTATATFTPTFTIIPPTATFTFIAPTATFTDTPTATDTATPLPPSETPTPLPTSTDTVTPLGTILPTDTSTVSAPGTPSNTPNGN